MGWYQKGFGGWISSSIARLISSLSLSQPARGSTYVFASVFSSSETITVSTLNAILG
jgi:hypothetical protein